MLAEPLTDGQPDRGNEGKGLFISPDKTTL